MSTKKSSKFSKWNIGDGRMPSGSIKANISEETELPATQQQEQSNPTPEHWEDYIHDDPD